MPKVTIVFGLLLCGLSAVVLLIKQEFTWGTWLIPSAVGLPLLLLGLLAAKSASSRMHVMHAAVTIALLGGLVALVQGIRQVIGLLFQDKPILPLAAGMIWAMTLLCFIFVGLCVQSFIAARKARQSK